MKKWIIILLILLSGCTFRSDVYKLTIDDYVISVGYDDAKYLKFAYNMDLPENFEAKQVIDDVNIYLLDDLFAVGQFTNNKNKQIQSDDATLTKLTIYLKDLGNRTFMIDDVELDSSIKTNCNNLNGTYINKNGYACVIETNKHNKHNVIELYGDYLDIDQDKLDHLVIYVD